MASDVPRGPGGAEGKDFVYVLQRCFFPAVIQHFFSPSLLCSFFFLSYFFLSFLFCLFLFCDGECYGIDFDIVGIYYLFSTLVYYF